MKIVLREPSILDRWENADDRHFLGCPSCGYFDRLLRTGVSPGVVRVIADHVRYEHELPG